MPTVREVALAWWEEKQNSIYPHEHSYYKDFLDLYILRFLGDEELSNLTTGRMDSYFTQVLFEQTYRNSVGRNKVAYGKSILQNIFDFAEKRGMVEGLPKAELTFRINQKIQGKPEGCEYSSQDLEQINKLISYERSTLTGLALGFAWYAGFTREEMLSLKWGDIDFKNRMITHEDARRILLEEPLSKLLQHYLDVNHGMNHEYIFTSKTKKRYAGPSLSRLVKTAKEKHRITDIEISLNALRNHYILLKLNSISSDDLPFLAQGLGVSPISLLNSFGQFLKPAEQRVKGIDKGFYKSNKDYWIGQLAREGLKTQDAEVIFKSSH